MDYAKKYKLSSALEGSYFHCQVLHLKGIKMSVAVFLREKITFLAVVDAACWAVKMGVAGPVVASQTHLHGLGWARRSFSFSLDSSVFVDSLFEHPLVALFKVVYEDSSFLHLPLHNLQVSGERDSVPFLLEWK